MCINANSCSKPVVFIYLTYTSINNRINSHCKCVYLYT